jgi:hypothetical protein
MSRRLDGRFFKGLHMVTFLARMLFKGLHMVTFGVDRGPGKRHAVTKHRNAVTFHRHDVQLKMLFGGETTRPVACLMPQGTWPRAGFAVQRSPRENGVSRGLYGDNGTPRELRQTPKLFVMNRMLN